MASVSTRSVEALSCTSDRSNFLFRWWLCETAINLRGCALERCQRGEIRPPPASLAAQRAGGRAASGRFHFVPSLPEMKTRKATVRNASWIFTFHWNWVCPEWCAGSWSRNRYPVVIPWLSIQGVCTRVHCEQLGCF